MLEPDAPRSEGDLAARPQATPATCVDVAHPSIDAAGSVFRTSGPTDREKEAFALLRTLWNDIEAFERLVQPDRHSPDSASTERSEAMREK